MSDAIKNEWDIRKAICAVGRRLYELFMVAGNDGNISVRLGDDEVLITPSGVSKGMMSPEMMIRMRCNGEIVDAPSGFQPSSEHHIHLVVYQNRPEVGAVIHAHPATATGMAVAGVSMEKPFLPEGIVRIGPVPLAPYTLPGGTELADSVRPYLHIGNAVLMGNHGVLAYDKTLWGAQSNMETVELNARMLLAAMQFGNVNYLSDEDVAALKERYL
jgi:L-fuculose-phosphate aldolase